MSAVKPRPQSKHSSASTSSRRKSRWDTAAPAPSAHPKPKPIPPPAAPVSLAAPPPASAYSLHNLERRTILLADGTARTYFALPPDDLPSIPPYDLPPPTSSQLPPPDAYRHYDRDDYLAYPGLDGPAAAEILRKRKLDEDEIMQQRQRQRHLLDINGFGGIAEPDGRIRRSSDAVEYARGAAAVSPRRRDDDEGRRSGLKYQSDGYDHLHPRGGMSGEGHSRHLDVDPAALKEAFLSYSKLINESASLRRKYLEDRKSESLPCLVCERMIKEFTSRSGKPRDYADCHSLIMHAYNSSVERVGHLGYYKALCVLMGWNYRRVPDDTKSYQSLSAEEQAANRADLIIWPPIIIIHNTILGKRNDGRVDGISNRDMDAKIKDLGFEGGKSKSMYGKDGHMGITIVKFPSSISGLTEAERFAEYFEKNEHGRKGWNHAEASKRSGENDEKNPLLVKVDDRTRIKKRILYGYLGTSIDLDKIEFDLRKKVVIKSRKELDISSDA